MYKKKILFQQNCFFINFKTFGMILLFKSYIDILKKIKIKTVDINFLKVNKKSYMLSINKYF